MRGCPLAWPRGWPSAVNLAPFLLIMKSFLRCLVFTALACTAVPPWVSAQIDLSTRLDHRIYLQFEPVVARTTVRSRIGQPVVLNSDATGPRFYYEVRNDFGHALARLPEVEPPPPVMMSAQGTLVFTNEMNRIFPMNQPGHYSIQPCVDWMGKTYRGEKRHLEVVTGREVSRITGVVPADDTTRTYMIFHINRGQQDHILLRIDDEAANLCYGVFALGRSVLNESPQLAVDAVGNAHILFQTAPRTYAHMIYSPFGARLEGQTFGQAYSHIQLQSQPNGRIEAVGQRAEKSPGPGMIDSILPNR